MAYIGAGQNKYTVFPLENYTFGHKAAKVEKQRGVVERFQHLREKYKESGMRRSVEGVVLVHKHRTVHVLLLQPGPNFFKLPGGRLKPGEDEVAGLQRKLTRNLGPEKSDELKLQWQVADCLGRFYRPNFEPMLYPYCPTHIERPVEMRKLFLLCLPERAFFSVPKNMRLLAVPLFELHEHSARYGPVISTLPSLLSRLHFSLAHAPERPQAMPAAAPQPAAPPQAPAQPPPPAAQVPAQQQQPPPRRMGQGSAPPLQQQQQGDLVQAPYGDQGMQQQQNGQVMHNSGHMGGMGQAQQQQMNHMAQQPGQQFVQHASQQYQQGQQSQQYQQY